MTAATATELGYTRQVTADAGVFALELLVQPEQDLGQRFKAWDLDEGQWLWVNGWMMDIAG